MKKLYKSEKQNAKSRKLKGACLKLFNRVYVIQTIAKTNMAD